MSRLKLKTSEATKGRNKKNQLNLKWKWNGKLMSIQLASDKFSECAKNKLGKYEIMTKVQP